MQQFLKIGYTFVVFMTLCGQALAADKADHTSAAKKMEKTVKALSDSLTTCKYAFELDKSNREALIMDQSKEYMKAHHTLKVPAPVQTKLEHKAFAQIKAAGSKFDQCRKSKKQEFLGNSQKITGRFSAKYSAGIRKMLTLWATALDTTGTKDSSQSWLVFSNQAQALMGNMKGD